MLFNTGVMFSVHELVILYEMCIYNLIIIHNYSRVLIYESLLSLVSQFVINNYWIFCPISVAKADTEVARVVRNFIWKLYGEGLLKNRCRSREGYTFCTGLNSQLVYQRSAYKNYFHYMKIAFSFQFRNRFSWHFYQNHFLLL